MIFRGQCKGTWEGVRTLVVGVERGEWVLNIPAVIMENYVTSTSSWKYESEMVTRV